MLKRLAIALLFAASPAWAELDHAAVVSRAATAFTDGFAQFQMATTTLDKAVSAWCETGADPTHAFTEAYAAWAAADFARFGPVEETGAALSINFWPDKKNFVGRALRSVQAASIEDRADITVLDMQSVAVQGFPALERLLEGDRATACPLAATIAASLAVRAETLLEGWSGADGWAALMRAAGPDNPVYLTPKEASLEAWKALDFGLEHLAEQRPGRPLGTFQRSFPKRAEAWRSGLSLLNAQAQFEGLHGFYEAVFAPVIDDDSSIPAQWAAARDALARAPGPLHEAVANPLTRIKVEVAQGRIQELHAALIETVGAALGVGVTFNSADGD